MISIINHNQQLGTAKSNYQSWLGQWFYPFIIVAAKYFFLNNDGL
jgi:hypothetical protein